MVAGGKCVNASGLGNLTGIAYCEEGENMRKVKFANMGLGLDDITMFVRFFLYCLNVEEYLFEITPILLHFRKYIPHVGTMIRKKWGGMCICQKFIDV